MGFTVILSFLQKNWKAVVLFLLVLGAYLYVNGLRNTVKDQQHKIDTLQLENTVIKDNNVKLTAAIETTNKSIEKISQGATETKKNFATLNANVAKSEQSLETKLRDIMASKKPVTCEDTIKYLIDAVPDYSK